jgi:hypothetical protein
LRRDELVIGILPDDYLAAAFHYNMVLLCVENTSGHVSFNLPLFREIAHYLTYQWHSHDDHSANSLRPAPKPKQRPLAEDSTVLEEDSI